MSPTRLRVLFTVSGLAAAGIGAALLVAPPARACGGFFCSASTLSPIYQGGERILFARDEGRVTMHIEVVYAGDPTKFGWILPLPEVPTASDGSSLPLDEVVGLSSKRIFDGLQGATDPVFDVQNTFADNGSCEADATSFAIGAAGGDGGAVSEPDAAEPESGSPPVVVLDEAKVGPYDAELLQAASGQDLFEWLSENGYVQDPNALPLLEHYVSTGFVFLGIRLQNDVPSDAIRPLALTFGETAPCVPLRLTSIAATPDMPILVWVLGPGRAVPKNFIHAVVNDQAIEYPGGSNYVATVTEAVESVTGRAFVTEYSGKATSLADAVLRDWQQTRLADALAASTLIGFLDKLAWSSFLVEPGDRSWLDQGLGYVPTTDPDVLRVLREEIPKPDSLAGYPYGNCFRDPAWEAPCAAGADDPGAVLPRGCCGADHLTTDEEFYGYLEYWAAKAEAGEIVLDVDLEALKARLEDEVVRPLTTADALFHREDLTATRFFTTMDPEAMTRDPIFAFNPGLPEVSRTRTLQTTIGYDEDCQGVVDAVYPGGRKHRFHCGDECWGMSTVGPVPGAEALLYPEVLDETGGPKPFDPSQAGEVDGVLAGAAPGVPSIPDHVVLDPPPSPLAGSPDDEGPVPDEPPVSEKGSGDSGGSSGCSGGAAGPAAILLALLASLAFSGGGRRRART